MKIPRSCYFGFFLTLALLPICRENAHSQALYTSPDYSRHIAFADSLVRIREYEQAIAAYQLAFHAFGGRFTQNDRYKYARTHSLLGNADSTIHSLKKLCSPGRYWDYPTLLKDTAFNSMKSLPGFEEAIECMKANKQRYAPNFNYAWRDLLDSVRRSDQEIRNELSTARNSQASSEVLSEIIKRMNSIDSANIAAVSSILDQNGLPGYSVIDLDGVSTIMLILLHSPTHIQQKYLRMVKRGVKKKDVEPYHLAMLEDKILVAKCGFQKYGSQVFTDANGKSKLIPIEDEPRVNKRRAKVGLEPLEQYLKLFGINYYPKSVKKNQ